MLMTAEIAARIFTSPNPTTGVQPAPQITWVVFAHGTVFHTRPTDKLPVISSPSAIAEAGKAALRELGPVRVGSPSGDFITARLKTWFPDEPVWSVRFGHPDIVTLVVLEAEPAFAGLEARRRRQRDYDQQTITCVRGFDGAVTRTP